jgi:hypothetical protein
MIDVDPLISDTLWLRNFAARLVRREDINPPFPNNKRLDVTVAAEALNQIFFTYADLDNFARAAPSEKFVGWVNVLLTEVNLSLLHRRDMLLCATHCGIPIYGNTPCAVCKRCSSETDLRINPKVLGPVVDETGCSQGGKLYLSDEAWQELLGVRREALCQMTSEELRSVEQRMLWLRVHMGIAWWAEEMDVGVGRVWVWAVKV